MSAIFDYVLSMALSALLTLPIGLLWRYTRRKSFDKSGLKTTAEHEAASVLFLMFMGALVSQTVIPDLSELSSGGLYFSTDRVNLVPLREIARALSMGGTFFMVNFIGNVAVFMPIAFFVALLYNNAGFFRCVSITAGCSVFVELSQLFMDRGTDVDDVILNTLGGVAGYCVYLVMKKALPGFTEKCKIPIKKRT